ncbi:hypothetical protein ACN38_g3549 [Penicillium nordicum]|uniref:Uncharacterized protein n=1 Tax=Penicillium nordicum TaxID=229535 RepID=A0A0M8P5H6_9EURO|nr:hypothetical protein ACN38_g3549 [Penicillium nordicum]
MKLIGYLENHQYIRIAPPPANPQQRALLDPLPHLAVPPTPQLLIFSLSLSLSLSLSISLSHTHTHKL